MDQKVFQKELKIVANLHYNLEQSFNSNLSSFSLGKPLKFFHELKYMEDLIVS